jgi:ferritin-like metal-binding protein YciE
VKGHTIGSWWDFMQIPGQVGDREAPPGTILASFQAEILRPMHGVLPQARKGRDRKREEGSMQKLARHNRDKVIDVLTGRLTFERAGVRLYDSIISKVQAVAAESPEMGRLLEPLKEHRSEEKEHEEWLEAQIRSLGGDVHAKTAMAQLVETESQGIEKIVFDGTTAVSHLFHALLTAELADNAGWDLLVRLADEVGDKEAKRSFKKRLREEEAHLVFARRVLTKLARRDVLGEQVSLPTGP